MAGTGYWAAGLDIADTESRTLAGGAWDDSGFHVDDGVDGPLTNEFTGLTLLEEGMLLDGRSRPCQIPQTITY